MCGAPTVDIGARFYEHGLRAFGNGNTTKRTREGLLFDMGVVQDPEAQFVSFTIHNTPTICVVIPTCIAVRQGYGKSPGVTGRARLRRFDRGVVGKGGCGQYEEESVTFHETEISITSAFWVTQLRERRTGRMIGLEVCVDTIDGVLAAQAGGASRVELCAALSEGGLTPPIGLMYAAAKTDIPCFAMIRPRSGLFHCNDAEMDMMHHDIRAAKTAGLAGVVLGVQALDGAFDIERLGQLRTSAVGMGATLHRVIDVVPDPLDALEQAIALGFDRVLTSGGALEAPDGLEMIGAMVDRADGCISVMPGCGLTAANVREIVDATGVREVHAACATPVSDAETFSDFDPPSGRMKTDRDVVSRMVAALSR